MKREDDNVTFIDDDLDITVQFSTDGRKIKIITYKDINHIYDQGII